MKINVGLTSIIIGIGLLLGSIFYVGYHQGKRSIKVTHDKVTIIKHDTTIHTIYSRPSESLRYVYINKTDTIKIEIPTIVDSDKVIKNYFTKIAVSRHWRDTTIEIDLIDTLFENHIYNSFIKYKVLEHTSETDNITNVTNYDSYLYVGADFPLSNKNQETQFNITYASRKADIKLGYEPFNNNYKFILGVGIKILNFK